MSRLTAPVARARLASLVDVAALVRLINRAYRVEDFFIDGDRTHAADVRAKLADPQTCFLVIDGDLTDGHDDAPRLAGAVYVDVHGDRGHFGMLAVDPAHQGRGLGRALVAAVEDHCRAAGCRQLDLEVVDLRSELAAFYTPLGFATCGTAPFPDPKKLRRAAQLTCMTKSLTERQEG
jgi:ribosomal protein S18 acetylase RimI-like enzyme